MKRKSVISSALKSVGYDKAHKIVEVEILENGNVYDYKEVPLKEYQKLVGAESIGWYYNSVFKKKFPEYRKLS